MKKSKSATRRSDISDFYEIGKASKVWLSKIGIVTREDFLKNTPEQIYEKVLAEKIKKNLHFQTVAKPLLYALRANRHYLETGEKVPFHFWKKIGE